MKKYFLKEIVNKDKKILDNFKRQIKMYQKIKIL
jgi:hypothetical protein